MVTLHSAWCSCLGATSGPQFDVQGINAQLLSTGHQTNTTGPWGNPFRKGTSDKKHESSSQVFPNLNPLKPGRPVGRSGVWFGCLTALAKKKLRCLLFSTKQPAFSANRSAKEQGRSETWHNYKWEGNLAEYTPANLNMFQDEENPWTLLLAAGCYILCC